MEDVMRLFRLHARRDWERGAIAAVWNRDQLFVPQTAPIYPWLVKARVGIYVAWPGPRR